MQDELLVLTTRLVVALKRHHEVSERRAEVHGLAAELERLFSQAKADVHVCRHAIDLHIHGLAGVKRAPRFDDPDETVAE